MESQLISVIVAAYNIEEYLERCIQSLVMQTYSRLEIILVDDGSTDKTGEICDEWARKDRRITVLHKENGGLSDARNAGIRKSRGQWLGFVDGDDYVLPTMYEHLYQRRTEKGITVCGFWTEKDGKWKEHRAIDKRLQSWEAVDLYLSNEVRANYESDFTYWGSYAWNKLYDSKLFACVSYPEGKKYEDMCIIFDLIQQAEAIQFIPECEYVYVQRPGSITHETTNVKSDSLQARLLQKEQLLKYWQITDTRMDKLLAIAYYGILSRYACLSSAERNKNKETAVCAWEKLQSLGYHYFTSKMKMKLYLSVYCPNLYWLLRNLVSWIRKKFL